MDVGSMKKNLMGAAAIAAAAASVPAQAQTAPVEPVKIGVIDTTVNRLMMGYKDVPIERKTFVEEGRKPATWIAVEGFSHGEVVASSFIERSRQIDRKVPISVYSANAFYYGDGPQRDDYNKPIRLDYKGAEKALQWFHDNGVRTVVAAFYTNDGPEMRSFMAKAKSLDMVLFAGTNNDKTKVLPFPARDPYAIPVTGTNANLDFANNPEMLKWTVFKMNGDTPTNDMLPTNENGSSFAVAKAAAFGAHYLRARPRAGRDEVVGALRSAAGQTKPGKVAELDGGGVIREFNRIVERSRLQPQTEIASAEVPKPAAGPSAAARSAFLAAGAMGMR